MNTPAETYFETAVQFHQRGQRMEALAYLQEALLIKPDFAAGWAMRGCVLMELQSYFDAVVSFDRAIAINDQSADYWNNRGSALHGLNKQQLALVAFNNAIEIAPTYEIALANKAVLIAEDGFEAEAIEINRKLLEADPDNATVHLHLGMLLIKTGQLKEGWQHYEWRTRIIKNNSRGIPCQMWAGQDLTGKTLLVFSEQGLGDGIQFMRYAAMVKQRTGAKVILEVNFPLHRLAKKSFVGVDDVICMGEQMPHVDYAISMMSLPMILGTNTIEDIPSASQYLSADLVAVSNWARRLTILPTNNLRVGLCWSGMSRDNQPDAKAVDARRSVTLSQMAELGKVKGVTWVSLQKGPAAEQAKTPPDGMTLGVFTHQLDDFYETAALIENLDLVITVDTAVAHLSGALGVPTWMLSRYDGCWRWGTNDQKSTPWYEEMRIFRQPTWGDWPSVMKEVATELEQLAAG